MDTKVCMFCEDYKWAVSRAQNLKIEINEDPDVNFTIETELKISLVEESTRYGNGWTNSAGVYTHRAIPFRYCPCCGKKLHES